MLSDALGANRERKLLKENQMIQPADRGEEGGFFLGRKDERGLDYFFWLKIGII